MNNDAAFPRCTPCETIREFVGVEPRRGGTKTRLYKCSACSSVLNWSNEENRPCSREGQELRLLTILESDPLAYGSINGY